MEKKLIIIPFFELFSTDPLAPNQTNFQNFNVIVRDSNQKKTDNKTNNKGKDNVRHRPGENAKAAKKDEKLPIQELINNVRSTAMLDYNDSVYTYVFIP